ncbi:MAG: hypothetical protein COA43_01285 [Robiginitomaculum sp.]|nr:MAG: hypothetical protein COA43_01285 [Robiginitomaculum sp.]
MNGYYLAELNIAEAKFPMDDARMDGFTKRIDVVNALADDADGFVWRLVDDNPDMGGALSLRPFDNPNMLVNMSVWKDIQSLYAFVFNTVHAKVMKGKPAWFSHLKSHSTVMWWVPVGHIPTLNEAKEKLALLDDIGPSKDAFTFNQAFTQNAKPLVWDAPEKDCA